MELYSSPLVLGGGFGIKSLEVKSYNRSYTTHFGGALGPFGGVSCPGDVLGGGIAQWGTLGARLELVGNPAGVLAGVWVPRTFRIRRLAGCRFKLNVGSRRAHLSR